MSETIVIEITEKIDTKIVSKIKSIAAESRKAQTDINALQSALNGFSNLNALNGMASQVNGLTKALADQIKIIKQITPVLQQNTTIVNQSAIAQQKLATAIAKTTKAEQDALTAAARLATEQERLRTQIQRTADAQNKAQLSALRLAEAQKKVGTASTQAGAGLGSFLASAAGLLGLSVGVGNVLDLTQAFVTMENKLQGVSKNQAQVTQQMDALFDIANRTRTSVEATTTAYARFDMALVGMGKSQHDTLQLTETINKALIVGGGTAQETSSALLQLSQAFNAGKLQGDEFRSVAENMPIAIDAIAKVTGKTRGELKQFASDGKITAKVLFDAFTAIRGELEGKFAKTVPTISQAMTVLKNNAIQTLGELDKRLGVSSAISKGILLIAQNMDVVIVAVTTLAAAIGTALIPAFLAAAKAATAMLLPLLANPFVLAAAAIAGLVAAVVMFGDKIKVFDECRKTVVTLIDVVKSVGNYIGDGFAKAFEMVGGMAKATFEFLSVDTKKYGDDATDIFLGLVEVFKSVSNLLIGLGMATVKTIGDYWANMGPIVKDSLLIAYNSVVQITETMINKTLGLFGTLFSYINDASEKVGLGRVLQEDMKVSLTDMKVQLSGAAEEFKNTAANNFKEAFNTDFVGNAVDEVIAGARLLAKEREKLVNKDDALRGVGPNTNKDSDEKAEKAAKKRAEALAKVNAELDSEAKRMFVLMPLREQMERFDSINAAMVGKGIALTEKEVNGIRDKIAANQEALQIQGEFDRLYTEAMGPFQAYQNTLQAITKLLSINAISEGQAEAARRKAISAYEDARSPMAKMTKDMQDQIKVLKAEPALRAAVTREIEIRNRVARGEVEMTEKEIDEYLKLGKTLDDTAMLYGELDAIREEFAVNGPKLNASIEANNLAFQQGIIGMETYQKNLLGIINAQNQMKVKSGKGTIGDSIFAGLTDWATKVPTLNQGIAESFSSLFDQISNGAGDAFANALDGSESFGKSIEKLVKSSLKSLVSSLASLAVKRFFVNLVFGQSGSGGIAGIAQVLGSGNTNTQGGTPSAATDVLTQNGGGGVQNAAMAQGGSGALGGIMNILSTGKSLVDLWNGTGPIAAAWKGVSTWASGLTGAATTAGTAATTAGVVATPVYTAQAVGTALPSLGAAGASAGASTAAGGAATAASTTGSGFMGMATTNWVMLIMALIANAFGMFRKKSLNGYGLMGTLGGEEDLTPWEEWKKGGTLFSGSSFSTKNPLAEYEALRKQDLENIKTARAAAGVADGQPFSYSFTGSPFASGIGATSVANDFNNQYNKDMEELAWNTKGQSDMVNKMFTDMRDNAVKMANGLGLAGDSMKNFTYLLDQQDLSFKDLEPEEIQKKIEDAINKAGGEMLKGLVGTLVTETVDVVKGTIQTNIANMDNLPEYTNEVEQVTRTRYVYSEFAKGGENALQTLTRLYTSFNAVNDAADALGFGTYQASLGVAAAADKMVEAFGGLEQFMQRTSNYINAYYSEAERNEALAGRGSRALKELGVDITPQALKDLGADGVKDFVKAVTGKVADKDLAQLMDIAVMIRPIFEDTSAAATSATSSTSAMNTAISDLNEAIKNTLKGLQQEGYNLNVQLLRLKGNEAGASILEIAAATENWDDASRAAYIAQTAYNKALKDQIDLLTMLPGLVTKYSTEEANTANSYNAIANSVNGAGFNFGPGLSQTLQNTNKAGIAEAVLAIANMPGVTDAMRLSLAQAADQLADLKDAQIEATKAERDRIVSLRDGARELSRNIGKQLGQAEDPARIANLWAQVNNPGDLEGRLNAAKELQTIIQENAATELKAQQTQLESLQKMVALGESLRDYVQGLKTGGLSALTPAQKMASAVADYTDTLAKAQAGDEKAQGRLQGVANTYLELAKDYDSGAYGGIFAQVTGQLSAFSDMLLANQTQLDVTKSILEQAEKANGLTEAQVKELTKLQTAVNAIEKDANASLVTANARLAILTSSTGASLTSQLEVERILKENANVWANLPAGIAAALAPLIGQGSANYNKGTDTLTSNNGYAYSGAQIAALAVEMVSSGNARGLYDLAVKNGVTSQMLADMTGTNVDAIRAWVASQGLPAFANGGNHMGGFRLVGERGPELEYTGSSHITSYSQTRDLFDSYSRGSDNSALYQLIEELSEQNEALREVIEQGFAANTQAVYESGGYVGRTVSDTANVSTRKLALAEQQRSK